MDDFSSVSDDQLADQIVTWSGRIAAGEARLLMLIAEFDRREAWGGVGLLSCAHWLAWRTGLSPGTARDRVRVARVLTELPEVRAAFCAGRLSYSQVRAITRVAVPDDQQRWIEAARCSTAGQLERLVRGVRRARKVDEDAADPELAAWRTRSTRSYDDDGNAVFRIVLPAEQAAVLDAALEVVRTEMVRVAEAAPEAAHAGVDTSEASAETTRLDQPQRHLQLAPDASAETTRPQPPSLAEVFVELGKVAIAARIATSAVAARRAKAELVAQIDPLTGWGRLRDGELLPPISLHAVRKSLPGRSGAGRLRPLTPADLRRHDVGRRQRLPNAALRELIGVLDGERCRFPGCTRRRKLHAHHVRYWRDGGGTDLGNLVLVCSRHHTLVHHHGFVLELAPDRRLTVATADGRPVLHHPSLPWRPEDDLDPDRHVHADTLPPDHVRSRIDLGYAVMVLMQQSA